MPRDGIAARSEIPADGGEGGISGWLICPLQAASSNVVISQVYGGGGNFWSDLSKRFHRIVQPGEFYRECVWPVGAVCLLLGHDLARDNTESRIYRNTRVARPARPSGTTVVVRTVTPTWPVPGPPFFFGAAPLPAWPDAPLSFAGSDLAGAALRFC
jgi:hypothetical protein